MRRILGRDLQPSCARDGSNAQDPDDRVIAMMTATATPHVFDSPTAIGALEGDLAPEGRPPLSDHRWVARTGRRRHFRSVFHLRVMRRLQRAPSVLANQQLTTGLGMVFDDVSFLLHEQRIREVYRRAERHRLARDSRRRKRPRFAADASRAVSNSEGRTPMLIQHDHRPGEFDAGHCQACAREAGLLSHYHHVQREESTLRAAERSAWQARGIAIWSLCSSSLGILLAVIALLAN
jgi:hypothetical protein